MNYVSFIFQNPWREGKFNFDAIEREILPDILKDINSSAVTVITGGRQVGKTTILMNIIDNLLKKGVEPKSVFYFNLDDFNLHPYFEQYTDFIQFINSEYQGFKYIFIDEIQRLKNPGIFLKLISDLKLKLKIIVSGSSSLELKSKISEHLTGRKHTFEIYPFSFGEFLKAKGVDILDKKTPGELIKFHNDELLKFLIEFIVYGGYPKVILSKDKKDKIIELKEIYDSYVKKDVKYFLNVDNISGYNNLVKGLAFQIGNLINYNELSVYSGLNVRSVKKYIDYLEGTYIYKRVFPYFSNARKEVSKVPKIFAIDTGLMNYVRENLLNKTDISGELYENFVFGELLKNGFELKFWRKGGGAEVDFVINGIPIEVKSSKLKKTSLTKSFISYIENYKPQKAYYLNLNLYGSRIFKETEILFYPLWLIPTIVKSLSRV